MPSSAFPPELHGKLWHSTNEIRFKRICASGFILAEPGIPDAERWHTTAGQKHYPYVRSIGGISLFDFGDFDPRVYGEQYPLSSWQTFVPFRKEWGHSLWIEIDRDVIAQNFISGQELLLRRRKEDAHGHDFMPIIEAACLAAISISAFRQILIGGGEPPAFQPYIGLSPPSGDV